MPDLTETLLADALAEFRATPLPSDLRTADTVRTTVRRRRQRHGVALTVLAVAAVTVPGAMVIDRHGHQPTPAATGTQAASAEPAPTAPTSGPPSVSPSPSATGTAPAVDPGAYVPASWLTPSQLPFNSTYSWVSLTPEPNINSAPATGHETSCSGMTTAIDASGGSRNWQLWGYGNKRPANQPITVQLAAYQFFYPDAAAAQHAFQQVQGQLSACGAERQVDIQTGKPLVNTVHQTASISNGFAFLHTLRTAAGQPAGTAILSADSHEYLVQRGRIIALIEVLAADAAIDQGNNDQGVLQQMANHLCQSEHC